MPSVTCMLEDIPGKGGRCLINYNFLLLIESILRATSMQCHGFFFMIGQQHKTLSCHASLLFINGEDKVSYWKEKSTHRGVSAHCFRISSTLGGNIQKNWLFPCAHHFLRMIFGVLETPFIPPIWNEQNFYERWLPGSCIFFVADKELRANPDKPQN